MEILNITAGIVIGGVILLFIKMISEYILAKKMAPKSPLTGPKVPIADLLAELNMLINLECIGVIEIPQSVKKIPLITDFNEIQMEIVHNVLEALSANFWFNVNMAGLKRDYIITYVTRTVHAELFKFMGEHNFAPVKDLNNK